MCNPVNDTQTYPFKKKSFVQSKKTIFWLQKPTTDEKTQDW